MSQVLALVIFGTALRSSATNKQEYYWIKETISIPVNFSNLKLIIQDGTLRMEMLQGDKFPTEITQANLEEFLSKDPKFPKLTTKIHDTTPVQEFLSGKNCLTGVRNSKCL